MTSRHYLVTGGLGFLGAPLVRALLKAGNEVRILDDSSRGSVGRLGDAHRDVEIIQGDIRDAEIVRRSVSGVDAVCHLAYVNGTEFFYSKPAHVLDVGVRGMLNVLDACIGEGVGELILASSSEVYQSPPSIPTDERVPLSVPDPLNPRYSYGGGKIISELMALNYGRQYFERVLVYRPHNVYGPSMGREHVIPQFIARLRQLMGKGDAEIPFPIQGTGDQTRSFVYVDDFIAGLMLIIEKGQHLDIYNVGTLEEVEISDLAHRVADYLGVRIRIEPGRPAEGGALRRCPDISKLQALGYEPKHTLNDGLPPTIDWYVANDPLARELTPSGT
ncbi:MAG: NAD-dependent epimerase/dehydratase family protein [Acidobacteria bacterium]|nr:NAD-dependent epimerase/dehydratase family protein [Acidobacteriota bacterium]